MLDYVAGEPISKLVYTNSPLPEGSVARILYGCSLGLSALHTVGIMHGDVAPSNVIVDQHHTRATLIDVEPTNSQGRSRGTPATMSPEVASGEQTTPLSDIYSLGCLAYFMLTGTHVFAGTTSLEICWKQKNHPCPKLSTALPTSPSRNRFQLANLVDQMLEKQPSQRPASAAVVAEQLSSLVES
ncbi:MAG: hypothetical protein Aurels2KO_16350 [Aureliella sp.]